ncbi:MAG: DUF502 domain-containing protein [Flavobacteriales bacterium]|nr:DUF502 domain-containing protein [Flavobacteriales bacterium]
MKTLLQKLGFFFLQGVLILAPLTATVYILLLMFNFIDELLPSILPWDIRIPGLGLLILLIAVTFIGFLGNTIIAVPFKNWFAALLNKAPLLKTIYSALMDFTQAIVGGSKKKFTQPVLVKLSEGIEKPGFITQRDLSPLGIGPEKVAVYLPHSYGFTGNLFIVPTESVSLLSVKSSEMMKFLISGGVTGFKSEESDIIEV